MALIATDREIMGGGGGGGGGGGLMNYSGLITPWYKNAHKLLNYGPITPEI